MRLILVRHGQSEANLARKIQGQSDGDLTEQGHREAELTALRIADLGPIHAIYTSPQQRALKTAAAIGARLGGTPIVVDGLREINLGVIDGLNSEESEALYPGLLKRWADDDLALVFPDGEPLLSSYQRAVDVIHGIVNNHPDQSVVVVTHGGVLAAYLSYTLDGRFSIKRIYGLHNCGITVLDINGDGTAKVFSYDEHGHLAFLQKEGPS